MSPQTLSFARTMRRIEIQQNLIDAAAATIVACAIYIAGYLWMLA